MLPSRLGMCLVSSCSCTLYSLLSIYAVMFPTSNGTAGTCPPSSLLGEPQNLQVYVSLVILIHEVSVRQGAYMPAYLLISIDFIPSTRKSPDRDDNRRHKTVELRQAWNTNSAHQPCCPSGLWLIPSVRKQRGVYGIVQICHCSEEEFTALTYLDDPVYSVLILQTTLFPPFL